MWEKRKRLEESLVMRDHAERVSCWPLFGVMDILRESVKHKRLVRDHNAALKFTNSFTCAVLSQTSQAQHPVQHKFIGTYYNRLCLFLFISVVSYFFIIRTTPSVSREGTPSNSDMEELDSSMCDPSVKLEPDLKLYLS